MYVFICLGRWGNRPLRSEIHEHYRSADCLSPRRILTLKNLLSIDYDDQCRSGLKNCASVAVWQPRVGLSEEGAGGPRKGKQVERKRRAVCEKRKGMKKS